MLSPFTIFAWYLTTFLVSPVLLSINSFVTVAIVPFPFWKSTMLPFVIFDAVLDALADWLPVNTQWCLLTASATAYNCEPFTASVESLLTLPAATF